MGLRPNILWKRKLVKSKQNKTSIESDEVKFKKCKMNCQNYANIRWIVNIISKKNQRNPNKILKPKYFFLFSQTMKTDGKASF